jgi:hypothetical protein
MIVISSSVVQRAGSLDSDHEPSLAVGRKAGHATKGRV